MPSSRKYFPYGVQCTRQAFRFRGNHAYQGRCAIFRPLAFFAELNLIYAHPSDGEGIPSPPGEAIYGISFTHALMEKNSQGPH